MKTQHALLLLLMLVGVGCQPTPQVSQQHNTGNGIYYWKTTFELNDTERAFLKTHQVNRLYLRLFDVVATDDETQNLQFSVTPNATIVFRDSMPENVEVVPVVYITIDALRKMQGHEDDYAKLITERVMNMADFNDLGPINEVQLDSDWTKQTQDSYFALCSRTGNILKENDILISCTIRLWQLSKRCPPVDRGVLMLYNTGNLMAENTDNSILDLDQVKAFLKGKTYPLPLSLAYPTFEWCVWFRDGQYQGLFHDLDLKDSTLYQCIQDNRFEVLKDHVAENRELKKGDHIRYESVDFDLLQRLDDIVHQKMASADNAPIIIYHLDSANLSNYSQDEIRQIYCRH